MGQASTTLEINLDYSPLPKQTDFHTSGAKYRLFIGSWRAGKSFAGCHEALKQSYLYPKNTGLIGRKDFTDLRDTTMRTFFEVCPEEFIKSYNKTEHHVVFLNGSEIYFRELKDGAGLGSLNLGWFYIDEAEEVEESIFERLKGRLSLNHIGRQCGWLTSNPPNEDHWIYKQFEINDDEDFFTVHASTYENKQHLPEDYIRSLEKLPTSWRKKYLEGQYGFTPDGVPFYQGYVEELHKRKQKFNDKLPLLCGWDFGKHHPAFVVTQWNNSIWAVLMEIMGSNITIDKFADQLVIPALNRNFPHANAIHFGDPAMHQQNDKSEFTSYQILQQKGIHVRSRQSEYRKRQEIIEKKLNTVTSGIPSLQVDPSCRIINDGFLGGYHYPARKPDQAMSSKFEQPFKDGFYEHLMNALEYVAVNVFDVIDHRPKPKPKRKVSIDNI